MGRSERRRDYYRHRLIAQVGKLKLCQVGGRHIAWLLGLKDLQGVGLLPKAVRRVRLALRQALLGPDHTAALFIRALDRALRQNRLQPEGWEDLVSRHGA